MFFSNRPRGELDKSTGLYSHFAARIDDRYELVAGALSSDPARAKASAAELRIAEDRAYESFAEMAISEAAREPALYWANKSALDDKSDPFILRIGAKELLENGYTLMPYSDPVWGEGKCDWEHEVRIEKKIYPLSAVMKKYSEETLDKDFVVRRKKAIFG